MRSRAIVSLDAIRGNYARLVDLTAGKAVLLCVVKADAYGHGAVPVSRALVAAGAKYLAVATFGEAVDLRDAGVGASVLVLGGLEPGQEREAAQRGIEPVVGSVAQLRRWDRSARRMGRRLSCHLLFNTGMNRLGMDFVPDRPASRDAVLGALRDCEWAEPRGVATHYASAEDFESSQTESQAELFASQLKALKAAGCNPRYVHAGNSAAIVYRRVGGRSDGIRHSMVRPGLALYGYVNPPRGKGTVPQGLFRPALEWRARLAGVRSVPAGTPLGYGASYVAPTRLRVGIVSSGYADGLDWRLSNRGSVAVRGKLCGILGQVSMDVTLVNLNPVPEAREGDEVVLLGDKPYGALEMAELAGGIPYQVLCGISRRVPREYRG